MGRRRGRERPPFLLCPLERTSTSSSLFSPLVFFFQKNKNNTSAFILSFSRTINALPLTLFIHNHSLCKKRRGGVSSALIFEKIEERREEEVGRKERSRSLCEEEKKLVSLLLSATPINAPESLPHTSTSRVSTASQRQRVSLFGSDPMAPSTASLCDAASKGDAKAVSRLLKQGVSARICDSTGHSPLDLAAVSGNEQTTAVLVRGEVGDRGGKNWQGGKRSIDQKG